MPFALSNKKLSFSHNAFYIGILILSVTFLSGCGKSDVDRCIDGKSHLWDNKTNDKNANKAYWAAVSKCKQQN